MKIEASCVAALVFAAASSTALAADPAANGAMTFPNVRTVNAPQATSTTPAASQSGMRVFKDSVTGLMRKPTAEELNTAAAEPRAVSAPSQFVTARGSVGVTLDESFLQYAVIARRADGSFAEACVPGATKAEALLKDTSWTELSKGDAHDR
jgi:hypothetical protein